MSNPMSWREFQAKHKGQGFSKQEISQMWQQYKDANGIKSRSRSKTKYSDGISDISQSEHILESSPGRNLIHEMRANQNAMFNIEQNPSEVLSNALSQLGLVNCTITYIDTIDDFDNSVDGDYIRQLWTYYRLTDPYSLERYPNVGHLKMPSETLINKLIYDLPMYSPAFDKFLDLPKAKLKFYFSRLDHYVMILKNDKEFFVLIPTIGPEGLQALQDMFNALEIPQDVPTVLVYLEDCSSSNPPASDGLNDNNYDAHNDYDDYYDLEMDEIVAKNTRYNQNLEVPPSPSNKTSKEGKSQCVIC